MCPPETVQSNSLSLSVQPPALSLCQISCAIRVALLQGRSRGRPRGGIVSKSGIKGRRVGTTRASARRHPAHDPAERQSGGRIFALCSSSMTSAGRTGDYMWKGTERPLCGAWVRSLRRGRGGRGAERAAFCIAKGRQDLVHRFMNK